MELRVHEQSHDRLTTYLLYCYVSLAGIASVVAIAAQRPEVIAIGAAPLVALIGALVWSRYRDVAVTARVDHPRGVEGDIVTLSVTVTSTVACPVVDVEVAIPYRFSAVETLRAVVALAPNESRTIDFPLELMEWGVASPERITVNARDGFGLIVDRRVFAVEGAIRIQMPDERLRSLLEPSRFRRVVGSHLSEDRGDGCEIADVRPYRPGDRLRSINWRISARRDEPWITVRHPDRSSTVVLVVDAYGEVGAQGDTTLRRTVRAAMALSRGHLNAQDRVGMFVAGSRPRWLAPQLGKAQMHRISDRLLDTAVGSEVQAKRERIEPQKVIPRDAVVMVISPLIDGRMLRLLSRLRSRGQPVHVIEPTLPPPMLTKQQRKELPMFYESRRVFDLEQEVRRRRLHDQGISVVQWAPGESIEVPLAALSLLQRARRIEAKR